MTIDPINGQSDARWPLMIDWKLNITTLGAIALLLVGWGFDKALTSSRIASVESQNVSLMLSIDKLASTVNRLDATLTVLRTQVEERQRQAEQRMDRGDMRQDQADLHNEGRRR